MTKLSKLNNKGHNKTGSHWGWADVRWKKWVFSWVLKCWRDVQGGGGGGGDGGRIPHFRGSDIESPISYTAEVRGRDSKQVRVRGSKHECRCLWEEVRWVSGAETMQRLKEQKKLLVLYTKGNREPVWVWCVQMVLCGWEPKQMSFTHTVACCDPALGVCKEHCSSWAWR